MPSVPLHLPNSSSTNLRSNNHIHNVLPSLLRTPSGLAILELQGTINIPASTSSSSTDNPMETDIAETSQNTKTIETELGKLMFPDYSDLDPDNTKWMKRVYLYAGRYQRMTGEVKKLAKPLAVIRRRPDPNITTGLDENNNRDNEEVGDELEIVDIIKYKIIFASRPEPVGME